MCKSDLILPVPFLVAFNVLTTIDVCHLPLYQCSYCFRNLRSFCKIHCSLNCGVLPCALVKYLVNRTAHDGSTAWYYVSHCLKPVRHKPLKNGVVSSLLFHWCKKTLYWQCFVNHAQLQQDRIRVFNMLVISIITENPCLPSSIDWKICGWKTAWLVTGMVTPCVVHVHSIQYFGNNYTSPKLKAPSLWTSLYYFVNVTCKYSRNPLQQYNSRIIKHCTKKGNTKIMQSKSSKKYINKRKYMQMKNTENVR